MINPLLDLSALPRFSAVQPEHVEPALDEVLESNRARIEEITAADGTSWEDVVAQHNARHRFQQAYQLFLLLGLHLFGLDQGPKGDALPLETVTAVSERERIRDWSMRRYSHDL